MIFLLAAAAALGAGAAVVLLAGTFPRITRRNRGLAVDVPIVLAALGGLVSRAELTGQVAADLLLGAGLGALAAWAGARAPHRLLAAAAVVVAWCAGISPWACAGVGAAVAVMLMRTRMPPVKACAGGLLGIGILTAVGPRGPGPWQLLGILLLITLSGFAARRRSESTRRTLRVALAVALFFVVAASAGFLAFAIPAARDLRQAVELSEGATRVLTTERGEEAASSLALAANSFAQARQRLSRWPARLVDVIPGAAQNAAALRALAGAGEDVAAAAGAATTGPADLRLDGGSIDLASVHEAASGLQRARSAVGGALRDLRSTRSRSLVPPVAEASGELTRRLTDAVPTLTTLERALEILPPMLGEGRPRRYLLALQTPAETRAAGGIIGAFGVLEADRGRLALTRTGNAIDLNSGGDPERRAIQGAEEFLARYGRFSPLQIWQNVSMTPDWPTVGHVASQLYPQSGGQPVDGVIGLDPFALAAILEATGPVQVPPWPVPIDADNAASVLLHEQYLFFPNPERREFVGDVTAAVFAKLTSEGTSLRAVALGLAEAGRWRSVQLWSANDAEQALFTDIGAAGAFPPLDDSLDLLSVVNQNSSGNKIDWFLHRKTSYDFTFDPVLGRVDARVRVELRNEAPTEGLPDYVIGSPSGPAISRTDAGENRSWVSVYTPLELKGAQIDGRPLEMEQGDEFGRRVYSAFVLIPPGGTVALELDLGGLVDPVDSRYRLLVRSQVLPNPEQVSVRAGFTPGFVPQGKRREDFELRGDRQLTFGFKAAGD